MNAVQLYVTIVAPATKRTPEQVLLPESPEPISFLQVRADPRTNPDLRGPARRSVRNGSELFWVSNPVVAVRHGEYGRELYRRAFVVADGELQDRTKGRRFKAFVEDDLAHFLEKVSRPEHWIDPKRDGARDWAKVGHDRDYLDEALGSGGTGNEERTPPVLHPEADGPELSTRALSREGAKALLVERGLERCPRCRDRFGISLAIRPDGDVWATTCDRPDDPCGHIRIAPALTDTGEPMRLLDDEAAWSTIRALGSCACGRQLALFLRPAGYEAVSARPVSVWAVDCDAARGLGGLLRGRAGHTRRILGRVRPNHPNAPFATDDLIS